MVDLDNPVIQGLLMNLVGEEGMAVILNMPDEEVTDEEVSNLTKVPLNIVRRTLYILFENRLASYRRERNKDSGWLTYLWKLDLSGINDLLDHEILKLVRNLQAKLDFEEKNMFYVCKDKCGRYVFDVVAEIDFLCPNCGEDVVFEDNELLKKYISKRIQELKKS